MMKKRSTLFFVCIVLQNVICFAEDIFNELQGSWLSNQSLSFYNVDFIPIIEKKKYKEIYEETLVFQYNEYFQSNCFAFGTAQPDVISEIVKLNDTEYQVNSILTYGKFDKNSNNFIPTISNDATSMKIRFLDIDEIQILDCGFDDKIWYRIDGPASIESKKAKCNDTRVRVRLKPNLNCQTLGFLNKNDKVIIKDRSEKKYEINGESWYWYRVDFQTLPDGWVYGKYLDFISDEEYEQGLQPEIKNNIKIVEEKKVTEKKLTKLEILQGIDSLASDIYKKAKQKENESYINKAGTIYKYHNNVYNKKENITEIINNDLPINSGIKIGMKKVALLDILGNPDEEKNNCLIYRADYGTVCVYTASIFIRDNCVEKIVIKRDMN